MAKDADGLFTRQANTYQGSGYFMAGSGWADCCNFDFINYAAIISASQWII